ncbi:MAG: DUF1934 domain-containing protein [Bacillaceae bacterium]|nr:DUF1934 domain-containing protein [Bacillaceae bacterium]
MDVQVKLETRINQEGTKQVLNQTCRGEWTEKGNTGYLKYQEPEENMGNTTTMMKIEPDKITLIRRGDVTMRHEYEKGRRTRGTYRSPYGTMLMETDTRELRVKKRRSSPNPETSSLLAAWEWDYELFLDDNRVGAYTMKVELKEVT